MKLARAWRAILLIALVFFGVHGLLVVKDYVGYASFAGKAGNIYELVIKHHIPVTQWSGMYGVAVRVDGFTVQQSQTFGGGTVDSENLLFDCLAPNAPHEIYASTSSAIDLSSATPASLSEVAAYFQMNESSFDSPNSTFTQNVTFSVGATSITAPGTYTYKLDESGVPQTFASAVIKDAGGRIVIVSIITANFTSGFNGDVINYQVLLPMLSNQSTTTYYFFTDPNDVCPEGQGEAPEQGMLQGNVSNQAGIRLANAIVEVAGFAALTDATGFYNLTTSVGSRRIFAIKEGYRTYANNVTISLNSTAYHNIVMLEDVTNTNTGVGPGQDNPGDQTQTGVGPGQDVGPGQSDGEDVGPGEAPAVPFVEQPKQIEGTDYIISLGEIKRKLRLDTFHQESLSLYSFKKGPVKVTFTLHGENLTDIITLDRDTLVIDSNSNDHIIITIWGKPPVGIYTGNLSIEGEINATIPIEIEVLPKDRIAVEALLMNIETNQKSVLPGKQFKFKTDLRNLLIDQPYPVHLLFTVQPTEGSTTVWSFETNVYLRTAFSLIRSVELPKGLEPGDYVLRASADYLGLQSSDSRTGPGCSSWGRCSLRALAGISCTATYRARRNTT
jgi:hypothetical protein